MLSTLNAQHLGRASRRKPRRRATLEVMVTALPGGNQAGAVTEWCWMGLLGDRCLGVDAAGKHAREVMGSFVGFEEVLMLC